MNLADAKFSLGQTVRIIKLEEEAAITGIMLEMHGITYRLSWFANGDLKTGWLFPDQIEEVKLRAEDASP